MNRNTNTSKYTAIARRKLSSPMKILKPFILGECLDYGCGRGFDCDYLDIDGYDIHWRPVRPTIKYDVIFCNFVLNVVTLKEQEGVINDILFFLKSKGVAFFTVRRDITHDQQGMGCIQRVVELDYETFYKKSGKFQIYKLIKQ